MFTRPAKVLVARSFGAAARSYDGAAALQRSAGRRLMAQMERWLAPGAVILDAGAGTGYFTAALMNRRPDASLMALDLSEGMLNVARERFQGWRVGGDVEALPLRDASIDLIFSNMAIQWCEGPDAVFREFRRVLRPGGSLLFTTLGPATLGELRQAWAGVDACSHVNEFMDVEVLQSALWDAGFTDIAIETDIRVLEYPDVMSLMRELKGLGAHNVTPGRPRHLMGKDSLRAMMSAYSRRPLGGDSPIRATFEVIQGTARVAMGRELR